MTTTNRTLNRIILLLLGLVAVIVGVTIGAGVLTPVRDALQPYLTLPDKVSVRRRRCGSSPPCARS